MHILCIAFHLDVHKDQNSWAVGLHANIARSCCCSNNTHSAFVKAAEPFPEMALHVVSLSLYSRNDIASVVGRQPTATNGNQQVIGSHARCLSCHLSLHRR